VNLRSIFVLITNFKSFLTSGCSIINISSLYGTNPQSGLMSHCISKAGLEALTKFAAAELAEIGIRVNAITACPVDTNCQRYVGVSEREYQDFKERVTKNIPLQRMANPDDIVKSVEFLASKRSEKITGQILKVDGGRSLTSSGYVPWKGMKCMNARFEPDGYDPMTRMKDAVGMVYKPKKEIQYPSTKEDIEKLINESNWSTRLTEAHEKIIANYKNIDLNDDFLSKFVNPK
jgi:hypothetical protein